MTPVPVIVAARRTAIGTAGSALAKVKVHDLAAPLIAEATSTTERTVNEVVLGNCFGPGGNTARLAALAGGLPVTTPAVTVDRQCGSGLEAVAQAAIRIRAGAGEVVLAGGAESASTAPWRCWPPVSAEASLLRYTQAPFSPAGFPDPSMGEGADELARRLGISREQQDGYAALSHQRSVESVLDGTFSPEILPVHGVSVDQRPRAGMTQARLSRLPPAFGADGTATAGNSCGISDGAALLTVVDDEQAAGLAIRAVVTIGCDPATPGMGAPEVIIELMRRTGLAVTDIGAVEVTEAFASVALATIELTGLDPAIVCADGGAIGYGHPWGASGAILLVRLFSRMVRTPNGPRFGIAACAIGGGQGLAVVVERNGEAEPIG